MSRSSTVDFTLRANITDLKSELGKIPGITDKEARKMAGAMEKGLLRAEKAAKKAGQAMRGDLGKSVDQAIEKTKGLALAAGMSEESFDKLKTSATKVAGQVDNFADKAGRADSSMSSMAAVIHNVNPELAELTRQAGDALGAVEGLILAAAKSPVTFAATAAAVGGLYLAFGDVNEEMERHEAAAAKAERASKKLGAASQLQSEVTERLRQKQAAQRGENLKIHDDFQEIDRDITAVIARYQKLAQQGTVSHDLAESIRVQMEEQRRLNEELYKYEIAQEKANRQSERAVVSAKLAAEATDLRTVALRGEIAAMEQRGESTVWAEAGLEMEVLDAATGKWAESQRLAHEQLLESTEAVGKSTSAIEMSDRAYAKHINSLVPVRRELEKLTGAEFMLVDANGRLVKSGTDWANSYGSPGGVSDRISTAIGLIDLETNKVYEGAEAIRYAEALKKKASADAIKAAQERKAAELAATDARIEGIDKEISAIQARAASDIEAFELEKLTVADRIDAQERKAVEEIQILENQLEAENALTIEKMAELNTARELIEQNFANQRQANEAEIAAQRLADEEAALEDLRKLREAADERDIEAARIKAEELASFHTQAASASAALMAEISSSMLAEAEKNSEKNRAIAMRQFRLGKAAATAEAIVNGALAITDVWSEHAANPPRAIALSALTAAVTGLQIGKIAAEEPSFHAGGIMPASDPSEFSARILPGESVLNQRATAALGESGVNALNHGTASPSIQVVPIPVYKHFDRFIRDEDKRRGRFSDIIQRGSSRALGQRGY